jgi:hypothetical protein
VSGPESASTGSAGWDKYDAADSGGPLVLQVWRATGGGPLVLQVWRATGAVLHVVCHWCATGVPRNLVLMFRQTHVRLLRQTHVHLLQTDTFICWGVAAWAPALWL